MMMKFGKYIPILTIVLWGACLLFGSVGLAMALTLNLSLLFVNTIIIVILACTFITHFLWLSSRKRSPLTRIQNGLAGAIIGIASWIAARISVNIPEAHFELNGLAIIVVPVLWLLFTNVHRFMLRSKIAYNIALASGIKDSNHPEIKRLSNNTILPTAAIVWGAGSSVSITTFLLNWHITNMLPDVTVVAIAWGVSATVGLLYYNLSPGQSAIRDFIRESQAKHQKQ